MSIMNLSITRVVCSYIFSFRIFLLLFSWNARLFLTRYKSFFLYCYKACASLFHIFYRITIERPPRSPDLIPCDFSSWGIIKDRVYAQKSRDLNHLKMLIKEEFTLLNDNIELCQTICRFVANRCQMCIGTEGK